MRRFLSFLFTLALFWVLGFAIFVIRLPAPAADALPRADAVAVFTGGGGARITAAMKIFSGGTGDRLLISGVHPETSRARLSDLWAGDHERFDCCVDLGHEALSTEGNAGELSVWAGRHRYNNIILVTSDYHIPRAMTVTRAKMKDANITPYAVASGYLDEHGRPTSIKATAKLAGEYSKFLMAYVSALFS
ncbi:YdcF family protein [Hyphococcus sp.]|uniref:YdcF family protein n=1 Tax=Hyphococcus sp. TaxID=2038636 RepID=UPI003CCC1C43